MALHPHHNIALSAFMNIANAHALYATSHVGMRCPHHIFTHHQPLTLAQVSTDAHNDKTHNRMLPQRHLLNALHDFTDPYHNEHSHHTTTPRPVIGDDHTKDEGQAP